MCSGIHDQRTIYKLEISLCSFSHNSAESHWLGLHIDIMTVTCDSAGYCSAYMMKQRQNSIYDQECLYKYRPSNFFISDPSHLIKTILNHFSRGKLWVRFVACFKIKLFMYYMLLYGNYLFQCNGQNIDW